ncbi:hypothetical protein MCOR25_000108 [Pyricularia grisea]|uniref:Secreted protein n=1 Tax=Pyricularia grisea TaxID=148305 RepID=A0A6P8BD41_PYRGI|nr:uncharacterized protein PgNI_03424 [Pyricularia grisea]KAI6383659.1 hypothetical protein MCOR25_000108 [Pyricularia grisea]TLD13750.1 hypothetical protein PgNI_03424 [Pyricularia grisea]
MLSSYHTSIATTATQGGLLLLAMLLFMMPSIAVAYPTTTSYMWPHVCQPTRFDEFLAVSKSTGKPVSLGPKGFYIHFGNSRCLFLRAETPGQEDKYTYYQQALVAGSR